jgi:hypothetical protein
MSICIYKPAVDSEHSDVEAAAHFVARRAYYKMQSS